MRNSEIIIQTRLGGERQAYYIFPEGTMVWLLPSQRGILEQSLQARKLEGKKIRLLAVWEAEEEIHLYFDQKHWQRSAGTKFCAYAKTARKKSV